MCGGKRVGSKGFFLEPAVITGVEDGTLAATEESFGPIMLISKFETLEEVRKSILYHIDRSTGIVLEPTMIACTQDGLLAAGSRVVWSDHASLSSFDTIKSRRNVDMMLNHWL